MHFEIKTDDLKAALKNVAGTVGGSLPITDCVLIERDGDRVKLTTNNLDGSTISYVDGIGEGFSIALPHRELAAIVNRARTEHVKLTMIGDHRVKIDAGRAVSEISGLDSVEFPTVHTGDAGDSFVMGAKDLLTGLQCTSYAMSKDTARPHLNGVFFQHDGEKLIAVATDGHRLAVHDFGDVGADIDELKNGVILSRDGALSLHGVLKSHDGDVTISVGRTVSVSVGDTQVVIPVISYSFPDYRQVLPPSGVGDTITVRAKYLLDAIADVAPTVQREMPIARLQLSEDGCTIKSRGDDMHTLVDLGELGYMGDDLEIGANVNYLIDALRAVTSDDVEITLDGALKPIAFRAANACNSSVSIVMPTRI